MQHCGVDAMGGARGPASNLQATILHLAKRVEASPPPKTQNHTSTRAQRKFLRERCLRLRRAIFLGETALSPSPYALNFDQALQDPLFAGVLISSRTRLIIVEENYSLLDEEP